MKWKKVISILLAAVLCMSFLMGCNNSSATSGTASNQDPQKQADKIIKELNKKFESNMVFDTKKQSSKDDRVDKYSYKDQDKELSVNVWFDKYTYEFVGLETYNLAENLDYHNAIKEKILDLKCLDLTKQEKNILEKGIAASFSIDRFGDEYKKFEVGDRFYFYDQGPDSKKIYRFVYFQIIKKDYWKES